MTKASARHILVETQEQCQELKDQIEAGGDLAVTYCTNLRNIHDMVRAPEIYYPRFVRLPQK